MEFEKEFNALARKAKFISYLTSFLLALSVFWMIKVSFFPDLFDSSEEFTAVEAVEEDYEYVPVLELDSADVVNGIHEPTGLIVDTGVEEVMVTCGACHSLNLVTQNRATRDGWKDIIVWMQETQKLWDLGPKEDIILDYLAKNYAPENQGRRKNLEVEEWYILQ